MSVHLFFVLKPYSKRQIHPPSPPQQTPPTRWKIRTNPGAPTESRRISLGVGSWKSLGVSLEEKQQKVIIFPIKSHEINHEIQLPSGNLT